VAGCRFEDPNRCCSFIYYGGNSEPPASSRSNFDGSRRVPACRKYTPVLSMLVGPYRSLVAARSVKHLRTHQSGAGEVLFADFTRGGRSIWRTLQNQSGVAGCTVRPSGGCSPRRTLSRMPLGNHPRSGSVHASWQLLRVGKSVSLVRILYISMLQILTRKPSSGARSPTTLG
jgi:hypothetical protein